MAPAARECAATGHGHGHGHPAAPSPPLPVRDINLSLWRTPELVKFDRSIFMNQGEWELLYVLSHFQEFSVKSSDSYAEMKFYVRDLATLCPALASDLRKDEAKAGQGFAPQSPSFITEPLPCFCAVASPATGTSPGAEGPVGAAHHPHLLSRRPTPAQALLSSRALAFTESFLSSLLSWQVVIRRRPLFYTVSLLLPSIFLMVMDIVGFYLPPNSGERVSFKITLLLGYSVFLIIVSDTLPATAVGTPLIGTAVLPVPAGSGTRALHTGFTWWEPSIHPPHCHRARTVPRNGLNLSLWDQDAEELRGRWFSSSRETLPEREEQEGELQNWGL